VARSVRECAGAGGRAVALELDRDAIGVHELLAFAGVVRWVRGRALAGRAVVVALEGELGGRVVLDEGPILKGDGGLMGAEGKFAAAKVKEEGRMQPWHTGRRRRWCTSALREPGLGPAWAPASGPGSAGPAWAPGSARR
jgi:hypothetical protein